MSKPNPAILMLFLVAVWAILGGVALAKGGFYLGKHEGDVFHLLQIVLRMVDGEWPHLDFMTPIGIMAFAPIALFVEMGAGVGKAIHYAQILVALVLLPAIFWAGWTRLQGPLSYLFGLSVLVLVLALVHGEAERSVSISMHYNRWAWAVSYVAILLAVLAPREVRNDSVDGVIIGLCMAFLLLCKVTYFAAFAAPIVVALALRGAYRSLGVAILAGLLVALAVTLLAGVAFWPAYIGDLLAVTRSEVRAQPGSSLRGVIGAPLYLGASLTLIGGVILLRQAEKHVIGLVLFLLVPGFFYVTYQNFGNDPQWLPLLGILLLTPQVRPDLVNGFGWNMRLALIICAAAALAFAAPSFFNLAYSPFRHYSARAADFTPLVPGRAQLADLQAPLSRSRTVDALVAIDGSGSGLEAFVAIEKREAAMTEWQGEVLAECALQSGMVAWYQAVVSDLEGAGLAGDKRVFAADIFSAYWLFGDLRRLRHGAPWYYGALSGFDSADYLLVPLCPVSIPVRKQILQAVAKRQVELTEIRRTSLYILYNISKR